MKFLIIFMIIGVSLAVILFDPISANEAESAVFLWKFCEKDVEFDFYIINGTMRDTAHLKLHDTHHCRDGTNPTDYQLQLFHTSNNQTKFTMSVPEDFNFQRIDVHTVGGDPWANYFTLNSTVRYLEISDITHDKHGDVTIIFDFIA